MKFNSHPPNNVFIKAVTIMVSRRAWPAQLYSAVSRHTVQTRTGSWEEDKRWRTTEKKEREDTECEQGIKD